MSCSCCFYLRLAGPLITNLLQRFAAETVDIGVAMKERLLFPVRRFLSRNDDSLAVDGSPEKVTGSTELKKATSSSTSSISSVTSIKTASGQLTSLSDQRLPPNLRPLPPTPGTSSFRPVNNSNTLPIPIRKISNTKTGILQFPWYHNVDRKRGEELVFNGEDGTFLVRPSSQTQNPYTLTIWFGKRVYNIGVRHRADGKYALGTEKQNEQSFRSVEEMVSYYQSEQLVLYSGGERTGQTALKSSPKKE